MDGSFRCDMTHKPGVARTCSFSPTRLLLSRFSVERRMAALSASDRDADSSSNVALHSAWSGLERADLVGDEVGEEVGEWVGKDVGEAVAGSVTFRSSRGSVAFRLTSRFMDVSMLPNAI